MKTLKNILKNILTGNWLNKGASSSNLYFLLFVMFLTVVLVYNRYRAEELIIKKRKLENEVEILHSEYTKSRTKLITAETERKTANDSIIISRGLKLPDKPMKKIIIKK